jgi:hypothetical protein
MLARVDDGDNLNSVRKLRVEHAVRESFEQRSTDPRAHQLACVGMSLNQGANGVNGSEQLYAQTRTLRLVPGNRLGQFGGGSRTEDDYTASARIRVRRFDHRRPMRELLLVEPENVSSRLLPWDSGRRIGIGFRQASIQFLSQFGRDRERVVGCVLCD